MFEPDTPRVIVKARLLVGEIQAKDAKTAKCVWELADLSAKNTVTGRPKKVPADGDLFTVEDWAEQIGWTKQGNSIRRLQALIQEARAWPETLRVENRTVEQHREARSAHDGNVEQASTWLGGLVGPVRPRARTISEITGTGPVYDATQKLIEARRLIALVPAKLAGSGILGNEENFPQFRRELDKLKNAIAYLDRYLADEIVVDQREMDDALKQILAGEETT